MKTIKGKKMKQVNNLVIYYTSLYKQFAVWYGNICLESFKKLEHAEEFCKTTNDFLARR
jgi:hypothetical protein